jgi:crotonobetainyl-CoA:carnitine CoA-transferase CaiB-like acyl-CoA transferase
MGRPEYLKEPMFATFLARKKHEGALDRAVEKWTRGLAAEEVMTRLQKAGVPSGVVKNGAEVYSDPQLRERDLFWSLPHSELQSFTHLGASFQLSDTPARPYMASPCLGEHTAYVCTEMLGIRDDEFSELLAQGVFE